MNCYTLYIASGSFVIDMIYHKWVESFAKVYIMLNATKTPTLCFEVKFLKSYLPIIEIDLRLMICSTIPWSRSEDTI